MDIAKYHSIKKFELIEKYVKAWAEILMLNKQCRKKLYLLRKLVALLMS